LFNLFSIEFSLSEVTIDVFRLVSTLNIRNVKLFVEFLKEQIVLLIVYPSYIN
jgi:hypothetical protein